MPVPPQLKNPKLLKDEYSMIDLKFNSSEFYTLIGFIGLAIAISIIGLVFIIIVYTKLNESSALLNLGLSSLKINQIDLCTDDCDMNLCFNDYNTIECLNNMKEVQIGCKTKEQCYTMCIEWYKGRIQENCFSNS